MIEKSTQKNFNENTAKHFLLCDRFLAICALFL